MSNKLIDELRRSIDEKHLEAIEALQTISVYLSEPPPLSGNGNGQSTATTTRPNGKETIRDRVNSVIGKSYASVDEVHGQHPTLQKDQIRGVVGAPDLKDHIRRKESDGAVLYRYFADPEEADG